MPWLAGDNESNRLRYAWLILASGLWPSVAAADAPACLKQHEEVQSARRRGDLTKARDLAIRCTDDACPSVIRAECATWVDELTRSLPTVVLHARGDDGCDLVDAPVEIDGVSVPGALTGSARELSPGAHLIRVQSKSGVWTEQRVVVAEGEKNRRVDFSFGDGTRTCGAAAPALPLAPTALVEERPMTAPTIVLGSIGLASLTAGAVLIPVGLVRRGDICAENGAQCDPEEVDGVRATMIAGDIAAGVGLAAVGVAVILHLTRPSNMVPAQATLFMPKPRAGGAEWTF